MNKKIVISIATLFVVLSGCSSKEKITNEPAKHIPKASAKTSEPKFLSSFTGKRLLKKESSQYFSVMIENSPDARPQSGLSNADLVYEIQTEGQITRYLAFFHDDIPEKIGPVRSSRHYFIPLAEERNVPYIHFGASIYAYEHLQNRLKVPAIDGIKSETQYFMRDNNRIAPHNAYLLTAKLPSFDTVLKNEPYKFGKMSKGKFENVDEVSISFNNFTDVKYVYDAKKMTYLRFQENEAHVDAGNGEQISVDNVILRYAKHTFLNDDKNRIDVDLFGENDAVLLRNGKKIEGKWKKNEDDIKFYDLNGNEFVLKPGKTWIEVVSDSIDISFK